MDFVQQDIGVPISIQICGRDLKNLTNLILSDTYCEVLIKENHQKQQLGYTEISKHNLNPNWMQQIKMTYYFNQNQILFFNVLDANNSTFGEISSLIRTGQLKPRIIGSTQVTLGQLIAAGNGSTRLELINEQNGTYSGTLIVYVEKVQIQQEDIKIQWRWSGENVRRNDLLRFGQKKHPFARFFKYTQKGEPLLIYETEVDQKTADPSWKIWFTEQAQLLQYQESFKVEVWDYCRVGGHHIIGSTDIHFKAIQNHQRKWLLYNKGQQCGTLILNDIKITNSTIQSQKEWTFIDYLSGGWQMSMLAGIDYTFSNGALTHKDSLHELSIKKQNYYQMALEYIGSILLSYKEDRKVAMFGFGGIPKLQNYTRAYMDECFPLNGDPDNPFVKDIQGMLQTYNKATISVEFSGPTLVHKLLQKFLQLVEQNSIKNIYSTCLLMTDGYIEDFQETLTIIGSFSLFPVSIIVVGVGEDDFKSMKKLENLELVKNNQPADLKEKVRDIVQFVAMKDFQNNVEKLSQTILSKLPRQFMEYMKLNNIIPKQTLKKQMSIID